MMHVIMPMLGTKQPKKKRVGRGQIIIARMVMSIQPQWVPLLPMLLVYLTCWAMFGSGHVPSMKAAIKARKDIV